MAAYAQANIEVFKGLLMASMGDATPYKITHDYLETKLNALKSSDQEFQLLVNILGTITTQFTIQAMESSRSIALEDLYYELKFKQLELETQKAAIQVELARAEIAFNEGRTNLVNAQVVSEEEKAKNIARERQQMDENLRIKEAEFLTQLCTGYAAGGVAVPEKMQEEMVNSVHRIVENI